MEIDGMLSEVPAKTILIPVTGKNKAWFSLEYMMNLYRGCCHGCIYCDSRSDCYQIKSFDQVRVKENALPILETELRRRGKKGVVGTGAMSDPYNPFEAQYLYTRSALFLLDRFHFGVAIATKSDLITRDISILSQIKKHSPVLIKMTITTSDDVLCKKIEPYVSVSSERFLAIQKLAEAGIFTGILLMPVLPWIEDQEKNILDIVEKAYQHGARFIYPAFGMTLRQGQREWYYQKLLTQFPEENLVEKYQKRYKNAYYCTSPKAKKLWASFSERCEQLGLLYRMQDIIRAYRMGYTGTSQMSLFDENKLERTD